MSFGKNLERLRRDRKISQSALGEMLNLTQQMISSYEKDASSPNLEILCRLADYFNISIDTLTDHKVNKPEADTPEAEFTRYFETLSSDDKERCIVIAYSLLEDRKRNLG